MKTMRGFTLIEMMLVVVVIAILAAYGVPQFQQMAANNRQVTNANMFVTSFQQARSEAITRSAPITISAVNGDWLNGWSITTADGTALTQFEAMAPQFDITAANTTYTYSPQGRLLIAGAETIDVCDDRTGEQGRRITLEPIGRVSVSQYVCDQS